jgi:hypothetical protein
MTQTNAIILTFHQREAADFERMFESEIMPMWKKFKRGGKIISASLTPVTDGSEVREGIRQYILYVKVPSMAEHTEFDSSAEFRKFLSKAQAMQPEGPLVWLGNTLFEV